MIRSLLFSAAVLTSLSLAEYANSQTTVATDPVGFTTVTVPAAPNATTPANAVVSTPLYTNAAFVGAVASVDSANSFTINGANFAAGQFIGALSPTEKPPHLVRLKTGDNTGRFFLITAHDDNTLTLDTRGYVLVSGAPANANEVQVTPGNSAEIFAAHTLNRLFPSGNPFAKGSAANAADNVHLFNGATWEVFFHNNTTWRKSGSLQNQNNTIVYPDDGMFIVRRQTSPLELTFTGAVPTTAERTDIPGPGSTYISNRFPVGTTIAGTNIHTLPGWQTASSANSADNVLIWNPTTSAWTVYFHNGTSWRKSGALGNFNTDTIPVNGTMFVNRRSTATGTAATLVQQPPYTL